MGEVLSIMSEV